MDVVEIVETLLEIVEAFEAEAVRKGEPARRAATAALVVSVMRHTALDLKAFSVENTGKGFKIVLAGSSIEVEPYNEGILFNFLDFSYSKIGRTVVPIMQRVQEVPVPALPLDASVKLGHALLTRIAKILATVRKLEAREE
jgi:hypothetical protein